MFQAVWWHSKELFSQSLSGLWGQFSEGHHKSVGSSCSSTFTGDVKRCKEGEDWVCNTSNFGVKKKTLHSVALKTTAQYFCLLDGLTKLPHPSRGLREKVKTTQSSAVRRSWGSHLSWKSSRGDGGSLWSHPLSYLQRGNNAASFLMKEGIKQSEMNATWGGHGAILCSN